MIPPNEAALALAIDRVRWALTYPRRYCDDDRDGRLRRALAALQRAWAAHCEQIESLFESLAVPSELPLTDIDRPAGQVRREHLELGQEALSLCNALRRNPSVDPADWDSARRRLEAIAQRAEALVGAVRRHVAWETELQLSLPTD
jgi:hypothetical protein